MSQMPLAVTPRFARSVSFCRHTDGDEVARNGLRNVDAQDVERASDHVNILYRSWKNSDDSDREFQAVWESSKARVAESTLISGRVCDSCQLPTWCLFWRVYFRLPAAVATRRPAKLKSDPASSPTRTRIVKCNPNYF
jgi:hypothetical protein